MSGRHQRTQACLDVEAATGADCFGCKIQTIGVSAAALPTRARAITAHEDFSKKQERDLAAYKRLRRDGYQPRGVMGSARVEQFANSKFEVESGHHLSSPAVGKKFDETQKFLTEGGLQPLGA